MARSTSRLQPVSEVWEWQLLGRCRDRSGTQFFHPDDDLGRISRRLREAAAKRLCGSCPVRRQCATHALTVGEEYGVWGGFSENDRFVIRQAGWRDTLDVHRLADVAVLERRLAKAREKAQQQREQNQPHAVRAARQTVGAARALPPGRVSIPAPRADVASRSAVASSGATMTATRTSVVVGGRGRRSA